MLKIHLSSLQKSSRLLASDVYKQMAWVDWLPTRSKNINTHEALCAVIGSVHDSEPIIFCMVIVWP